MPLRLIVCLVTMLCSVLAPWSPVLADTRYVLGKSVHLDSKGKVTYQFLLSASVQVEGANIAVDSLLFVKKNSVPARHKFQIKRNNNQYIFFDSDVSGKRETFPVTLKSNTPELIHYTSKREISGITTTMDLKLTPTSFTIEHQSQSATGEQSKRISAAKVTSGSSYLEFNRTQLLPWKSQYPDFFVDEKKPKK